MRSVHKAAFVVAVAGTAAVASRRSSKAVMTSTAAPTRAARATTKTATPKKADAPKRATKAAETTTRKVVRRSRAKTEPVVAVPAQRRSEIDELGLRVEELEVAEHEARDERLFAALDWA